ncbi:hypothetical protein TEA_006891 [Camellia sinensis var. sinensis]|uniref:Armadillo repeat-containing domain-containing protein n=1 Tax=Camellia sinensis var. sinensis TaxID=542762 RepID=A0A4S4DCV8_CAMSN|nr:hypothetical protein TEA_006891 [Camellia sinensis var. sinensis]
MARNPAFAFAFLFFIVSGVGAQSPASSPTKTPAAVAVPSSSPPKFPALSKPKSPTTAMTVAGATPLVQVPSNQNLQPLMDLSETPHPSQFVATAAIATANYDNEYEDDLAYTPIYKTQPSPPTKTLGRIHHLGEGGRGVSKNNGAPIGYASSGENPSKQILDRCLPPTPPPRTTTSRRRSSTKRLSKQRLQALIEGARESWTYAIFWQSSSGDYSGGSLLGRLSSWLTFIASIHAPIDVHETAAGALWNLAFNPGNALRIVDEGGVAALVRLCFSSSPKKTLFQVAAVSFVFVILLETVVSSEMDEFVQIGTSSESTSKSVSLDEARRCALRHIKAFVLSFYDPQTFAAATASSSPAALTQVAESARIPEAGHLRCSQAEIGRFVAMLRNPSSILKECAVFALLQFTIPGGRHTSHHVTLLQNSGAPRILRVASAAAAAPIEAKIFARIVLRNLEHNPKELQSKQQLGSQKITSTRLLNSG